MRSPDRLALIGQIASGLAHELGTPLNASAGRTKRMTKQNLSAEQLAAHVTSESLTERGGSRRAVSGGIAQCIEYAQESSRLRQRAAGQALNRQVGIIFAC